MSDPTFFGLFGDETRVLKNLAQFEFLVEWNSYLAVGKGTKQSVSDYVKSHYPDINFAFWPSLIAFDIRYISPLVTELFTSIQAGPSRLLEQTVLDPAMVSLLGKDVLGVFLECVRALEDDHEGWMHQVYSFGRTISPWPQQLEDALGALPPRAK
jgi:hypothetical protein